METMIYIAGAIALLAGAFVSLAGASSLASDIFFNARWKWAHGVELKRSVKLGWNVGEPPEGVWVLIRNNLKRPTVAERIGDCGTECWQVMRRKGGMMWSQTGGYGMPVKNVSGWLEVVDG